MTDPYNYPSIQRDNTMYLSTIGTKDFSSTNKFVRESSFQKQDIQGSKPKCFVKLEQTRPDFLLSTYVEPIPNRAKTILKTSEPLRIDDIEGTKPRVNEFRTRRNLNPLNPNYDLPAAAEIAPEQGRRFLRDTLSVGDINSRQTQFNRTRGLQLLHSPVEGSSPKHLTKLVAARNRLQVKDINKDGIFESTRHTDPLSPHYLWRDQDNKQLNKGYGPIMGNRAKSLHPSEVNKPNDFCLNTRDIDGAMSGSFFNHSHFIDKRREFRNYMQTKDIEKCEPSSLKKGIETMRRTNPLMPQYKFPGHTEVQSIK